MIQLKKILGKNILQRATFLLHLLLLHLLFHFISYSRPWLNLSCVEQTNNCTQMKAYSKCSHLVNFCNLDDDSGTNIGTSLMWLEIKVDSLVAWFIQIFWEKIQGLFKVKQFSFCHCLCSLHRNSFITTWKH